MATPKSQMDSLLEHAKTVKRILPAELAGELVTAKELWRLIYENLSDIRAAMPDAPSDIQRDLAEAKTFEDCWGSGNLKAFLGASLFGDQQRQPEPSPAPKSSRTTHDQSMTTTNNQSEPKSTSLTAPPNQAKREPDFSARLPINAAMKPSPVSNNPATQVHLELRRVYSERQPLLQAREPSTSNVQESARPSIPTGPRHGPGPLHVLSSNGNSGPRLQVLETRPSIALGSAATASTAIQSAPSRHDETHPHNDQYQGPVHRSITHGSFQSAKSGLDARRSTSDLEPDVKRPDIATMVVPRDALIFRALNAYPALIGEGGEYVKGVLRPFPSLNIGIKRVSRSDSNGGRENVVLAYVTQRRGGSSHQHQSHFNAVLRGLRQYHLMDQPGVKMRIPLGVFHSMNPELFKAGAIADDHARRWTAHEERLARNNQGPPRSESRRRNRSPNFDQDRQHRSSRSDMRERRSRSPERRRNRQQHRTSRREERN